MKALQARDIIFGVVNDYALAQTPAIAVKWPDTAFDKPAAAPYFDTAIRHATSPQASLADSSGARIWENAGVCSVTVNVPIARGLQLGYTHGQGLIDAFRAYRGSVWFRNIRLRELGSEGGFERMQVLTDFEYRDIS